MVPLTNGIDHAAHDLAEVAREALYDMALSDGHNYHYEPPRPRCEAFRVRNHLDEAHCWVLHEIARWSPPGDGPRRFDVPKERALERARRSRLALA